MALIGCEIRCVDGYIGASHNDGSPGLRELYAGMGREGWSTVDNERRREDGKGRGKYRDQPIGQGGGGLLGRSGEFPGVGVGCPRI